MALYEEVFQSKGAVFTIRNAGPQDAQAMLDYMGCVDRETTFLAREPGEFERGFTLEKERAYLAGCQESPGELFLLAVTPQGVVAGSSHCSFRLDRARYRHRAELALSVRQDYWRQGLGRRLMEIQETWCRGQGIEKLCLEVDTWRWTPKTCGPWGCTSAGALRWRAPCAGRRKWPTAPTGICTSWGSF